MSNLRQAAQQAHEALMIVYYAEDPSTHEECAKVRAAITALRAALDEPESDYERGFVDGMQEQMKRSVDKAVNRMADPEQKAWFTVEELNDFAIKLKA